MDRRCTIRAKPNTFEIETWIDIKEFLDGLHSDMAVPRLPLAGQFCLTRSKALDAKPYPLTWSQYRSGSLVQVILDIPDDVLFSQYNYSSSTVGGLVRHFEQYDYMTPAQNRIELTRRAA